MKTQNTIGPAELISEAVNTITINLTEALTRLVLRGEEVAERAEAIKVPAKRKARQKAKPKKVNRRGAHVVGSGQVTLTTHLFRVWLGCQALLNAQAELVSGQPVDKGFTFNGCSGRFVATFLGREFWTQKAANSVGNAMGQLKDKGLLTWENQEVPGKSNRSIRSGFGFGPNA
jgi:hypothetical protein